MTNAVVVGTGFGCFTHVRALRAAGFEVVAVVGRDPFKTATRAHAFGVPHACASLAEALALADIDAVTIATPPHTHAPLVRESLAAGKHVLCEKPFARDAAEARALVRDAEQAGVVHLLGTEYRFDTGQAVLARAVRDGLVGEPRLAMFVLDVPMLADPAAEVPAWWADAGQGGGWLHAHGSQVIDQIRVTLGEFASVTCALVNMTNRAGGADDGFVVHFRSAGGAHGVMQSTASDRGPFLVETRVIGSQGSVWIDGVGATVRIADANGTRRLPTPDELRTPPASSPPPGTLETAYEQMIGTGVEYGAYVRLAEHFLARVRAEPAPPGPEPATFVDGLADMCVLDAMLESAATGATVNVAST